MADSRTKNSIRNIVFSIMAYFIQIVLGFLARRYFIYFFSEEYLGLNSLFTNILSMLSLAELGFGTAIVFAMYKPMADGDEEKVRQLLQFYKKCYFTIGLVVIIIGVCVFPFMGFFEKRAPNVDVNLYIVYAIFLFNSVISYFFSHRRSLLYTSQRNDIESKVNMLMNILLTGAQLVAICFVGNYYLYIVLTGIFAVMNNLLVYIITQKKYSRFLSKPENALDGESKQAIKKNIKAMIFHKIGSVIVYSTDSLVIFLILGSASLGKYSNYLMITTYVSSLLAIFTGALRGSIGNSIASESVEKNFSLMKKLNSIYFWLISFCTISIFVLADPFIDVVLTIDHSKDLLLDKIIIFWLSLNFYLTQSRYMTGMFKECAGLFYQDRFKPIFESLVNLIVSIILANFIGLQGVIIGTIVSTITVSLWVEPKVLYKHYYKKSVWGYWGIYAKNILIMLISGALCYFVCMLMPHAGLLWLAVKFAVCISLCAGLLFVLYLPSKEFRESLGWGKQILLNLFKKKSLHKVESQITDVNNQDNKQN